MINFIQKRKSIFFHTLHSKEREKVPTRNSPSSFFPFFFFGLSSLSPLFPNTKKKGRWMKNIQTKKQRNFLKVLRMEMKKLSKFFFLETKTNNSNLISTSISNTRFFFQTQFSLSLVVLMNGCVVWYLLLFLFFF